MSVAALDDNPLDQEEIIRARDVRAMFAGHSDMWVRRKQADPVMPFPKSFSLGGRTRFFDLVAVERWKIARAAADALIGDPRFDDLM